MNFLGIEGLGKVLSNYIRTCDGIKSGLLFEGNYCPCSYSSNLFMQGLSWHDPLDFYMIFVFISVSRLSHRCSPS